MATVKTMQGLTPTIIVTISAVDLTEVAHVYPSLKQGRTIIRPESFEVSAHQVDVYLTQSETLLLIPGDAEIQINWTYANGQRGATVPKPMTVSANHLREVLE